MKRDYLGEAEEAMRGALEAMEEADNSHTDGVQAYHLQQATLRTQQAQALALLALCHELRSLARAFPDADVEEA